MFYLLLVFNNSGLRIRSDPEQRPSFEQIRKRMADLINSMVAASGRKNPAHQAWRISNDAFIFSALSLDWRSVERSIEWSLGVLNRLARVFEFAGEDLWKRCSGVSHWEPVDIKKICKCLRAKVFFCDGFSCWDRSSTWDSLISNFKSAEWGSGRGLS